MYPSEHNVARCLIGYLKINFEMCKLNVAFLIACINGIRMITMERQMRRELEKQVLEKVQVVSLLWLIHKNHLKFQPFHYSFIFQCFLSDYQPKRTAIGVRAKIIPLKILATISTTFAPYLWTRNDPGISEISVPIENDDKINPCSFCDHCFLSLLSI